MGARGAQIGEDPKHTHEEEEHRRHELGRVAHGDQPLGDIIGWHVAEVLRVERLGFVVLGLGHGVWALELDEPDEKLQGLEEFHLVL